jgi:hypothetical protein
MDDEIGDWHLSVSWETSEKSRDPEHTVELKQIRSSTLVCADVFEAPIPCDRSEGAHFPAQRKPQVQK